MGNIPNDIILETLGNPVEFFQRKIIKK